MVIVHVRLASYAGLLPLRRCVDVRVVVTTVFNGTVSTFHILVPCVELSDIALGVLAPDMSFRTQSESYLVIYTRVRDMLVVTISRRLVILSGL